MTYLYNQTKCNKVIRTHKHEKGLQTYRALEELLFKNLQQANEVLLKKYNFDIDILHIESKHFHKNFLPFCTFVSSEINC